MLEQKSLHFPQGVRSVINNAYRMDELTCIHELIDKAALSDIQNAAIRKNAIQLVEAVRNARRKSTGIDSFLTEYALSSEEGIALMCLAEAFLRVPDSATIDSLIKDKLAEGDWRSHRGQSPSFFVNATTWALMLTGKILTPEKSDSVLTKALMKLVNRSSEKFIRSAVEKAMRIMSKQFVMGRTIDEAISRARKKEEQGYLYSYDMLGEAALTAFDAERYFQAYANAIEKIGKKSNKKLDIYHSPGISVKLSALHPRYFEAQHERVMKELCPRLLSLAQMAKQYDIALTVDAEETERLDLSLDIIEKVFSDQSLTDWNGFGLAVQSYQKRAFYVLDWVAELARREKRRIMVRLIKGAYWDSEIKKAQMQGLSEYPVFTRKAFTDVSFQACVRKILTMTDAIYPQFATHNAYSVAMVLNLVGEYRDFEFQCLHGMGAELYDEVVPQDKYNIPCRIYAPVGSHEDLLPYLVRRLLENGANSSFVNRIVDEKAPVNELAEDPIHKARQLLSKINNNIPLPENIFMPERKNSRGLDLTDRKKRTELQQELSEIKKEWRTLPVVAGKTRFASEIKVISPQQPDRVIGYVAEATKEDIESALAQAESSFKSWSLTSVEHRVNCLEKMAGLLEENMTELLAMACLEAGKTWSDGIAEVREAADFCRYYAISARQLMGQPLKLSGYTGETNELSLHPRGTILCISPWNFPLAIFTGQIVAALVTGNCVIAKPAEQTPLIAGFVVNLLLKAGIPEGVIQLLPGTGEAVGAPLVEDKRIKGVIFTGSTETANRIHSSLAAKTGAITPLIAETGGQNAMIVDSSALPEQVIMDVLVSAFGSAGQRCSALRVLYIQDEVYPRMMELLKGAMAELQVGDPSWFKTDVGPVIDAEALANLQKHVKKMAEKYEIIYQCDLNEECEGGYFMPPTAIAIDELAALKREVFGPVLHVIRYQRKNLDQVINDINNTQYGLTLGVHSRINETIEYIRQRVHVGNCYVNRNMTGAIVGLQPFGGEELSGTGPKAGGPHYLLRLCHERVYTIDTTAAGGNASLMSLSEEI
ncbi:bifunctional proline dehydrogenase/L-glutamate gamma-semialdehyde dehydrogenase PutA [Legionella israelensis]|uniref:Bifunctional protein PutA n=1 Tax=Legionella israelensis TaxID=454 RepID=A0A0W0W3L1_9GAMM|nr:bifunctional proline dehydrogenase/L-glutamate gamma-semialdehyde dehydrogenase PutA [Legionella israelensis]KTD26861.1 bifunctional PutA protein [Legionella israelensis]QBS08529.1 bifunctional proline dehydrogenase/L-glutamate gamma-semialdehyde dehydrogenase PutA [Legionella israelensis]SCX76618.1 L-proline dehydrogenase /delta-1-pyrroline-5-carboxylate dehydrogenase [Legionella israelensis DSM 19235]STX58179.1 bifunctional PutA protein [Legionella israelensis]